MKKPNQTIKNDYRLLLLLWPVSWFVFAGLCVFSLSAFPRVVSAGVLAGGLLVLVNFHFFHRVLMAVLRKEKTVTPRGVLPKYYLRFFITIVIVFILISQNLVSGLGLILGFSTFIITIFSVLIQEAGTVLYKKISKEAT